MRTLIVFLLLTVSAHAFDSFCFKEYESVQMQDYCEIVQEEMSFAVNQYYGIMKMADDEQEVEIIKTCLHINADGLKVDWENVYYCILNY